MNLTELQVELRDIEEHISQLHSEIEKMKPKTDEQKKTDFEAITKLARKYPIKNMSIAKAPDVVKKELVSSLAYLIRIGENDLYNRLLYLCRFALGCGLNISAEDIYKYGSELKPEDIEKYCIDLKEYKHTYLIEAFTLASMSEEARADMLSAVADIAQMLQCNKEEILVFAQVAKSKLTDDTDILDDISLSENYGWSGKLGDYIPDEWIVSKRIKCADILLGVANKLSGSFILDQCKIKSKLQAESIVKKGDKILVYEEKIKNTNLGGMFMSRTVSMFQSQTETRTVTAPCDGMVFFVKLNKKGTSQGDTNKCLEVYVVSYFDDYNEFCKWHKSKS